MTHDKVPLYIIYRLFINIYAQYKEALTYIILYKKLNLIGLYTCKSIEDGLSKTEQHVTDWKTQMQTGPE